MEGFFIQPHIQRVVMLDVWPMQLLDALRDADTVDSDDSDNISFSMMRDGYHIRGVLQRWEGTRTRLKIDARVTVPQVDIVKEDSRARIAFSFAAGALFAFFVVLPMIYAIRILDIRPLVYIAQWISLISLALSLGFVLLQHRLSIPKKQAHWRAQQQMVATVTHLITQLQSYEAALSQPSLEARMCDDAWTNAAGRRG